MCRPFWSGAAAKAVVVEADAFKETDVIYRALSSRGHHTDMLQTAELVNLSHDISEIHYKINMYQQSFTTAILLYICYMGSEQNFSFVAKNMKTSYAM